MDGTGDHTLSEISQTHTNTMYFSYVDLILYTHTMNVEGVYLGREGKVVGRRTGGENGECVQNT